MKKIALLLTLTILFYCEPEKKADYVIVSGKIENAKNDKITVFSQYNFSDKKDITLNEDGTFLDTLKMITDFFVLRENRNMIALYAPKGNNVKLKYDAAKKDSTLLISGDFSAVNNYFIAKEKVYNSIIPNSEENYKKEEAAFKTHIRELKKAQEDLLFNTVGLPESYKNLETKNINYEYLNTLNNFQAAHSYYTKNKDFKVSDNFLDELDSISFESEEDFKFSVNYRGMVSNYFRNESQKMVEKDTLLAGDIAYLKKVSSIQNETIKNKLLFDDAQYGITYTDNLDTYYSLFSKASTDEENNKIIQESYNNLKKLAAGSTSPKFTNYENNAGGKMSLDDLKGTYVYFDIWATWCGPCIAEIPSLKKVEKQFHDKNIAFVSISIDTEDAYNKWKKMIVDKELGGIQLLADKAWESKFIEEYMIKGIPRFILLDPEGNIINSNAPRPSDAKLVETLNSLL